MKYYSATGHRPATLGVSDPYDDTIKRALFITARDFLGSDTLEPGFIFTGMALGWDQAIADACIYHGIPFIACVPFLGQERRWPKEAQHRYRNLLNKAYGVINTDDINPDSRTSTVRDKLMFRNTYMVQHSEAIIALWNGTKGGTYNTLMKAKFAGMQIYNLYSQFQQNLQI